MARIQSISAPRHRELFFRFSDGVEGFFRLDELFTGVAEKLNDPTVFATAHIIDEGYAVGFDGCEYDICATAAHQQIVEQSAIAA